MNINHPLIKDKGTQNKNNNTLIITKYRLLLHNSKSHTHSVVKIHSLNITQ